MSIFVFNICFSREKQRLIKSDPVKNNSSPANSDGEVDGIGRIAAVTKQVTEAEAKLKKNRYAFHCQSPIFCLTGRKEEIFLNAAFKEQQMTFPVVLNYSAFNSTTMQKELCCSASVAFDNF